MRAGEGVSEIPIHDTRLRKCRLDAGLSQRNVAAILEIKDSSCISRWERGERLPGTVRLLELSALYHRLVNELLFPMYSDARERVHQRRQGLDGHNSRSIMNGRQ
jgi:transcriptional regulator with XRE-family HTH domain